MSGLFVEGMYGLGDNFYQLPIVRELAKSHLIYLRTPWPQLYGGLGIKLVNPVTALRVQAKNCLENGHLFEKGGLPAALIRRKVAYTRRASGPFYQQLTRSAGLTGWNDYCLEYGSPSERRGNYVVVRPVTLRKDWPAPARNPDPIHIQRAIDLLRARGIETVVLADIEEGREWYDQRPENADCYFERGEKKLPEMIELVRHARAVVGPVGFIAPLCIAVRTPGVIIHGGMGGMNAPEIIDAPGLGKLSHVLPAKYCHCRERTHTCDKRIDPGELEKAISKI